MTNPDAPQSSDPQPAGGDGGCVTATSQPLEPPVTPEAALQQLVAGLPLPIALVDGQGSYWAASPAWLTALSLPEAIPGQSVMTLCPELATLWQPAIARASQGQTVRSEQPHWLQRSPHPGLWLEWEVAPWGNGGLGPNDAGHNLVCISLRVVSDRVVMEQAWKQLFIQSGSCLCTINSQGEFQFLNETWDQVLGWREEAIGRPFTDYVHPDDRTRTQAETHFSSQGTPTRVLENRYRRKDGTYRWFRWNFFWDRAQDLIYAVAQDITERRVLRLAQEQADTALRDNNERFRTMVANVPGVIYRCLGDRERTLLFASEAIEHLTGYRAETFVQYRNRTLQDLTHPEDRDRVWTEIQAAIAQQQPYRVEYRLGHVSGELRWVVEQGQPSFNHNRQLMWLDGVIFDVTDRKATEQALQSSKKRWSSLVQRIPVAIIEWLSDGRIITWNRAATELFGYTAEDMINQPFDRILPENEQPKVYALIADLMTGRGGSRFRNYNRTRDGRIILCEWQNAPLRNEQGDMIGCLSIATDITARILAEDRLRQSEERYRCLVEAMGQTLWRTNADGEVTEPMPHWAHFTGQSFADYCGQGWLMAVHPDDRGYTQEAWQTARQQRQPYKIEHRLRRADGEYRHMVVRGVPVLEADGTIREWVGVDTDITERKQAEIRLMEQERTLRTVLDTAPLLIWLTDAKGRVQLANRPLCQTFGVEESTLLAANHYQDVLGEESCRVCLLSDQRCLSLGKTIQVEEQFPNAAGELRDFDVVKTPLRDHTGAITGLLLVAIDTTERKQIEREQQRLLAILEATTDFVGTTDIHGNLTYVNPAGCTMLGYSAEEILRLNIAQLLHPSERNLIQEQFPQLLQEGVWQGEGLFCDRAGNPIPVSQVALVHYGRNGQVEYLSNVARNIAALKQVEQALRDSQHCLQRQVERERLINTLSTEIRKSIHGSKEQVIGFALEEIRLALGVDLTTFALYDQPVHDQVHQPIDQFNQLNQLNQLAQPLEDQQLGEPINQQTDQPIDQQADQPATETILVTNSATDSATEVLAEGAWSIVAEARDPAIPSVIGTYHESQFGSLLAGLTRMEVVQIDDVKQLPLRERLTLSRMKVRSLLMVPVRIHGSRMAVISCLQMSHEHRWQPDEVALVQAVVNQVAIAKNQADLFERTEMAAAEARAKAIALEQALRELRLTQTKLVQQEKMSSLGQLVAGVAHEINNPVNFIYGNLAHTEDYSRDLLRLVALYRDFYPDLEQPIADLIEEIDLDFLMIDLPKMLDSMKLGAERIKEIVQSLRIFSRMDEAEMKVVNIHEGLDSTLTILNGRMKPKNNRLGIEVIREYGTLPEIECYAGQLNQVFMNILVNAIDTLEERDQQRSMAEMQANPSRIRIMTERRGEQAIIRIQDNGLGIPQEVQQRLFDPFYTTKPVGKGTGLGLSISYQIVTEKHGGTLICDSTPGAGSTFEITIPLWQPNAPS